MRPDALPVAGETVMKELTIRLGLNEQILVVCPNGREILLQSGTAEETLRRMLRTPRQNDSRKAQPPEVPDGFPVQKFTKTGRPVKVVLTLEDLEL